jgi:hypothetical protein
MIKRLLERILNWIWERWRQHEWDVLGKGAVRCDGGMENRVYDPAYDFLHAVEVMRDQLDQKTRDALLQGTFTNVKLEEPTLDFEAITKRMKELEEARKGLISMIVITRYAPPLSMLKCRYEDKWYLLVNASDWAQIKDSLPTQKAADLPYSPFSLTGIPVVEDDELARKILISALLSKYLMN